mmetsp:Transcript_12456/g.38224  ORF Transcript_12456/g.38224 Transcript_12456/m.38224 type:complete len:222 (+) Transcript_12456:778-1443(+)
MSQPTSTTVAVTMSPTRHASKIGIPRAFLLVSVDSDPVDSSSSASSAAYNSSSSASSNVSKDDATVTPSTDSRRVSSDGVRLETPLESLSSYSDGVDLDSGTPASRASAIPLCSRTPGSLSSSLLGSGGVAGGVWWRSLSGGTFALGLGLGFGGALRGRGGFFLGFSWAFFWLRSRARRHVASASRLRSARRSLSASASRSAWRFLRAAALRRRRHSTSAS